MISSIYIYIYILSFQAYQGQGTVTDFAGFNAEDDCKKLEESIRTPLVSNVTPARTISQVGGGLFPSESWGWGPKSVTMLVPL